MARKDASDKKPGDSKNRSEDETAPVNPDEIEKLAATSKKPEDGGTPETFDEPTKVPAKRLADVETLEEVQTVPAAAPNPTPAETQVKADLGRPPDMPTSSAPPPLALGNVEDPAHMPGPRDIPGGEPHDTAPAPGRVPPGDSRSLRRSGEFALIYRLGTYVISRVGQVGTRGQWRVVEYPTSSSASHSYAKECSRFVSEGFSDYRE